MKLSTVCLCITLGSLLIASCSPVLSGSSGTDKPGFKMTVVNGDGSTTYNGNNAKFRISELKGSGTSPNPQDSSLFVTWPPFGYPDSSYVSIDTISFNLELNSGNQTATGQHIILIFERIGKIPPAGNYSIISAKSVSTLLHKHISTTDHLNDSLRVMFNSTGSVGSLLFLEPDSGSINIQKSGSSLISGTFQIRASRFVEPDSSGTAKNVTEDMFFSGSFTATRDTALSMQSDKVNPVFYRQ